MQETGKNRFSIKEQYYTKTNISKKCIDKVVSYLNFNEKYLFIEPSAGNGSFSNQFPENVEKIALDLDPKEKSITKQDFLLWTVPEKLNKTTIVIGNPPFGRQSCLAKKFIKKSCLFADIIAFILPRSFVKSSMNKCFDNHFHCILSENLENDSFIVNSVSYDVPCVFQIWKKELYIRQEQQKIIPENFCYKKNTELFDFVVRRVGGNAGKSFLNTVNIKEFNKNSNYFIKLNEGLNSFNIEKIVKKINNHVFPENNTVGPKSISKPELNLVLNNIIEQYSL
jgi:predicted RNA methylase